MTLRRSTAWFGWGVLAFLAVGIALFGMRFLTLNPAVAPDELRQNLLDHPFFFFTHTVVAPFALIVGVWQFLPVTRRTAWHRWVGRVYVACVAVASVAGFIISFTTTTGPAAGISFAILAVLWFAVTARAYLLARAGDFVRHRVWMIRSYALTCAGISLRLILPIGMVLGYAFTPSYIVAAWGCWTANLVIAELIVRRTRFRETVPLCPSRAVRAPA